MQNQAPSYLFETEEMYGKNSVTFIFYRGQRRGRTSYKVFTVGGKDCPPKWVESRAKQALSGMGYN